MATHLPFGEAKEGGSVIVRFVWVGRLMKKSWRISASLERQKGNS